MTAHDPTHPDRELFRQFAIGNLGDADVDRIAAHLADCAACRGVVDDLLAEDGFSDRLRSAATVTAGFPEDQAERRRAARALRREAEGGADAHPQSAAEGAPPREVGEYSIVREIGRGGMGVVYQARHRSLHRLVALKMILAGEFASEAQRQRFRREAELAARVQHPNIVPIYEIGIHDGHPFLAMEWVDGGTLAERIGHDHWTPWQAAQIVETLGRAINAAHLRGVVHRDLKPSNILLHTGGQMASPGSVAAIPKVADFGLARAIDGERSLTKSGVMVGTPEYMAPEQATGGAVGPAADIYALGAILYQLLTGQPPFRGDTPMEVLSALTTVEPVAPRRYRPRLARDLETIVQKAMAKDPARRYGTAGALADDLRRFLACEPILARAPKPWQRAARWVERRPALAGLAAALAGVTVLAFIGITALWIDAAGARDRARSAAALADRRSEAERRARYQSAIAAAASALALDNFDSARAYLDAAPEEYRNWEWRHFAAELDNAQILFQPPDGAVGPFALSPSGDQLAYALAGGLTVRVCAADGGNKARVFTGHQTRVTRLEFSPDGSLVAAGAGDGTTRVWNIESGTPAAVLPGGASEVGELVFSPSGARLVCSSDGIAIVWDLASGRRLSSFPGRFSQFSPDGERVLSFGSSKLELRNASTGAAIDDLNLPKNGVTAAAISPDGRFVAAGLDYPANEVRVWDVARGGRPAVLSGHKNAVNWLAFSRDGRQLASSSADRTVRLWNTSTGALVAVLSGPGPDVGVGTFSLDGRQLVITGADRTARIWETREGEPLGILRGSARKVRQLAVSRDGAVVAMANERGGVGLWHVDLAIRQGVLRGHAGYVYDVAFSPDGRTVASAAWDGTVRLWDAGTGRETSQLRDREPVVTTVAFSPDGRRLASVARHGQIRVWDVASGHPVWSAAVQTGDGSRGECRVAYSLRGESLAVTGGKGGAVWIYDAVTGKQSGRLGEGTTETLDAVFSPTGRRIVTADADGMIRTWDVTTRKPVAAVRAHDELIYRIAYSPDGRTLASASQDSSVRLRDAETLKELASWRHGDVVYGLAYSPDGTRLASACKDGTVRLLDVVTLSEVAELRGHGDYAHAVAFSPDGTRLVSGSGDYTVRVWDSLAPTERRRFQN